MAFAAPEGRGHSVRTNLPVNDVEYPFPRGQTIVSKTDLKGIITYANDAFIEASLKMGV